MLDLELIVANMATILVVVGVLCTFISVVTEFTKEIGIFNKIPTPLQVLLTSQVVCMLAFYVLTKYKEIAVLPYYYVGVVFAGFMVAIICARGWDYLIDIWKRFYRGK